MMEWPEGETTPTKFTLTSLRRRMSKKQIVRTVKERYRTEQAYEELKGELGLEHFEGRSFPGWHHHVTVVLCCYAFILAERSRHFPPLPSGKRTTTRSVARPERHFARLLRNNPPRHRSHPCNMVAALSLLPSPKPAAASRRFPAVALGAPLPFPTALVLARRGWWPATCRLGESLLRRIAAAREIIHSDTARSPTSCPRGRASRRL